MAFSILIVEDEELYVDQLEMLIEKMGYAHQATVDNAQDALGVIQQAVPDLILMDINIAGEYDGIELVDLIHRQHLVPVIFITSLKDEMTFKRAARSGPLGYLIKPFDQLQLQRSIELTVKQLITPQHGTSSSLVEVENSGERASSWDKDFIFSDYFFIKTRQKLVKVSLVDILYLEADRSYCNVHTVNGKLVMSQPMSAIAARLPENFVKTHRSYIVNSKHITGIELAENLVLLGNTKVNLSKSAREDVLKKLNYM